MSNLSKQMTEYNIYDRINHEVKEITKEEAENILKPALYCTGSYGYMGYQIDKVLYCEENNSTIIKAVCYMNEWIVIPNNQNSFMEFELSQNSYEDE